MRRMPNHAQLHRRSLTALACTAAFALAAAGALLIPGPAQANSPDACPSTQMSSASQPACWRPFSASSPFNSQLSSSPALAPDSATVQQHMATYGWSIDGSTSGFSLSGSGTRPVYYATASDPVMTVRCTDEDGPGTCQGTNNLDVNGVQIHVPTGAEPDSNWDGHMTVIETATDTEYDFWHTSVSGTTLTAGAGSETSIDTSNGTGSQGDAAYFALSAGLLRPAELASGQINHALVVTVPCTNATGSNVGYSYPALGGWGEYCGEYWNESAASAPMLGQRFQLNMTDAQIAASGAPSWEQTIMTALAHYGAYIEDTNGSWQNEGMDILTQDPISWTSLGAANQWASVINQLGGSNSTLSSRVPIPESRLQLVNTCVTQGTCSNASTPTPTPGASNPPSGSSPTTASSSPTTSGTAATATTPGTSATTGASRTPVATSTNSRSAQTTSATTTSSSSGSTPTRAGLHKKSPHGRRSARRLADTKHRSAQARRHVRRRFREQKRRGVHANLSR